MGIRYRVSRPNVMHETIDEEVIVIDLATGNYYSLRESAAAVWRAVEAGGSEAEIVAHVESAYDGSREEIAAGVGALLADLQAEGVIETDDAGGADSAQAVPVDGAARKPFTTPKLERYSDMQELILLDPVHEVGPRGWPQTAEEAGKGP